jgi:hypothetical protein
MSQPPHRHPGQPPDARQPGGFGPPAPPQPPQQPPQPANFSAPAPPGPYGPGVAQTPPPATPTGWGSQPAQLGQPGVPGVPPGMARPRPSGARVVLIISAVVALLLAACATVLLVTSGDDSSPPAEGDDGGNAGGGQETPAAGPIDAALAWSTPAPKVSAEDMVLGGRGSWITGDTLVRTLDDAITAYRLDTGDEAWSLPLDLSGGDCNASPTASDNRVAVLQGRDCEALTVIDIAAGEEITTIELDLERTGGYVGDTAYPAILGDTIALGTGTTGMGFSASTGEQLWASSAEEDCPEVAYAVIDDTFVSRRACGFAGDEGGSIRATNEAGEELWEWEYGTRYEGQELKIHSVVSIEPLVVTAWMGDDIENETIFVIDENHQEISHRLDYDFDRYRSPCMVNTLSDCKMAVVQDGFLYLASKAYGSDNAVVAFELSSGNPLYEVEPVPEEGGSPDDNAFLEMRPFAARDGKVLVYQRDVWHAATPGMVVAIDPATERATPVMHLDPAAIAQEAAAGSPSDVQELRLIWHENTLLMLTESFYGPDLEDRDATLVFR